MSKTLGWWIFLFLVVAAVLFIEFGTPRYGGELDNSCAIKWQKDRDARAVAEEEEHRKKFVDAIESYIKIEEEMKARPIIIVFDRVDE